jgi:hypothetical protein
VKGSLSLGRFYFWRPVAAGLALMVVVIGCAPGSGASTGAQGSPSPNNSSTSGAVASASPDQKCRDAIVRAKHWQLSPTTDGRTLTPDEIAALAPALHATFDLDGHPLDMILFSDGSHDFTCLQYPSPFVDDPYFTSDPYRIEMDGWPYHFLDAIGPDLAIAVGPTGGSSEYGNTLWGAARDDVASVEVTMLYGETNAEAGLMESVLQNGYFAAFSATGPCCIYRVVARDAAGNEIKSPLKEPEPAVTATPVAAGDGDIPQAGPPLVRASSELTGSPADHAVDGDSDTTWNAGRGPIAWWEIVLDQPSTVDSVTLVIEQTPRGQTLHRILVAKPGEPYVEAHRFAGVTASSQSLVFKPEEPLQGIAFVRVVTDASPSSVAWREIVIESTPP